MKIILGLCIVCLSCVQLNRDKENTKKIQPKAQECESGKLDTNLRDLLLFADIDDAKLDLLDSYYLSNLFYLKNAEPEYFAQVSIRILLSYHRISLENFQVQGVYIIKEAHNHISLLLFLDSYTGLSKNFETSGWSCEIYNWANKNRATLCPLVLKSLIQLDSITRKNKLDVNICIH